MRFDVEPIPIHTLYVYGDNQGALKLVRNPEYHQRTRHIHNCIRDVNAKELIDVKYLLTKQLQATPFKMCLKRINFC